MSKKRRRRFTAERKAAILKRHFADKIPISDLCDEYKIQPSQFYTWRNAMFENLESALEQRNPKRTNNQESKLKQRVDQLETKLARKDNVIAEISEEYVKLKKELGES